MNFEPSALSIDFFVSRTGDPILHAIFTVHRRHLETKSQSKRKFESIQTGTFPLFLAKRGVQC